MSDSDVPPSFSTAAGAGPSGPPVPPGPPPDVGWLGDLHGLGRAARGMVSGRLSLLALELRRAQHGLVSLLILGVVAAIAGATAWIALWALIAALAVHLLGLSWPWAFAGVLVFNLLVMLWVVAAMKSLIPLLSLPASRRQFHWLFNDPNDPPDPRTAAAAPGPQEPPAHGHPTATP
ncbi:MAG: hypothetical protein J7598_14495 [Mitsuaria chitosanitabida]|uniref:hypothetical protein n=1 Tax=Roseateles chitosanitabidus TaxID=65048 RepID=UPI001B0D2374|nr:hypothetical protein [Roseateles chitosanitabidus]MBO9687811.1 hypothetical protein [Roseateles chitosanitabidus]